MTASAAPALRSRLTVQRPGFAVGVDLDLAAGKVTALFGPSGSGKTTCLRAIAGLERSARGLLAVGGEVWQDDARGLFMPTHRRALGYVFQEASLFAHLSVRQNIEYGMRRVAATERGVSLERAVRLLGIEPLLERGPGALSGGERQRVAIARALAASPRLLLLDEPLAALDAPRKMEILGYLEQLQNELGITVLYVSHAADEVARLAHELVLIDAGRVQASGATADLMTRLDLSLAHGDGAGAVVEATVTGHDPRYHLTHADCRAGPLCFALQDVAPGTRLRLRIQARDVSLTQSVQSGTSVLNILPATIAALADDGPGQVMVQLAAGGSPLLARITAKSADALALAPGRPVYAQIKGVAILG
ncbi:MAG: Molybdenum ABC transporter ATP-binding protein ModC [Burkholderiaceae bacterium]|jgi:molybdate transport system ATP-binding protein|nr:MAG: Molybdenum ABC transporter ATP-binding protein ModC [Burkholderiaceae bacterium]